MILKGYQLILSVIFAFAIAQGRMQACSMYKITVDGKTMMACNHDAWLTTPKIWFENARQANEYGAAFTGAREVSNSRTTPQSGMNTAGLSFSRLTSYHPIQDKPFKGRLKINDEAEYLSDILHKCASIKELKEYIERFDHSFFINDVFIYVDSLGDYLIVEPYRLIEGNKPNYILANFCPSITDREKARKFERYRKGEDYLNSNRAIASLDFCRILSDTMSVCRGRNRDGTLLTSIWDSENQMLSLYFYHNYDTVVQFSLEDELAKGDHSLKIPSIFPRNPDFERLVNYKTPSNTVQLRVLLLIFSLLLALFPLVLLVSKFWKNGSNAISGKLILSIGLVNLLLMGYIFILITNKGIFYFEAPYKHYGSRIISYFSYMPFLLLFVLGPIAYYTRRVLISGKTKSWLSMVLVSNKLIYLFLILGFSYWGLYSVWI